MQVQLGWLVGSHTGRFFTQQHFKLTLDGERVGGALTKLMYDEGGGDADDDANDANDANGAYMVAISRGLLWLAFSKEFFWKYR